MSYRAPERPGENTQLVTADHYMPFAIEKVQARKDALNKIINGLLVPGVDFGEQPGSANHQKVLKKSGAEKLCSSFGLAPRIVEEVKTLDWTGEQHAGEPFFSFEYRIALYRGELFLGEATASCNSWEKKYRYQWVSIEEAKDRPDFAKLPQRGGKKTVFEADFALDKKETTGKYGKPLEYWHRFEEARRAGTARRTVKQFKKGGRSFEGFEIEIDDLQVRIPNPNAPDVVNTVQKMSYKRALVAAVVVVTNCSDAFTQDLDDEEESQQMAAPEPDPRAEVQPPAQDMQPPPPERLERSRPVPEEMRDLIARLRREPKFISDAYQLFAAQFARRGVEAGRAYEALNLQFRTKYPKGSAGISDLENHITQLLDLYDKLQTFPEPVEA